MLYPVFVLKFNFLSDLLLELMFRGIIQQQKLQQSETVKVQSSEDNNDSDKGKESVDPINNFTLNIGEKNNENQNQKLEDMQNHGYHTIHSQSSTGQYGTQADAKKNAQLDFEKSRSLSDLITFKKVADEDYKLGDDKLFTSQLKVDTAPSNSEFQQQAPKSPGKSFFAEIAKANNAQKKEISESKTFFVKKFRIRSI